MQTKTAKAAPTFLRTSYTEKLVFPGKPDAQTRRALREAGFRWNSVMWFRTQSQTLPIRDRDLVALLAPTAANDNAEQPEAATA
ncbi:MAG: hypothetical protein P4L85_14165 [Paludisphaera borealis]|uniref:hypothetical protein n=1 Tax=Paludisphaera borealis TaxID=1387353 RepID=UPI00284BE737|nr:hypothetical protein [Paludisphaera borealis]MDR3620491.1 hypothetical protein [Paludisphaera borealis]